MYIVLYLICLFLEEISERSDPQARLKNVNPETKYTLEELKRDYKEPTITINKVEVKEKADKFNAAHYSTGAVAASFTSTVMVPKLIHEAAIKHEDEVRYDRVKKKGKINLSKRKICKFAVFRLCQISHKFGPLKFGNLL
jgi:peptidyl-prolyl cis-trans isomerase-like protein 2